MVFTAVLVNALHAALEDAEIALNRVRVNFRVLPADVLAHAVLDALILGEGFAQTFANARFVSHQRGFLGDVQRRD